MLAALSEDLGEAMVGINEQEIRSSWREAGAVEPMSPTIAVLALQGAFIEHEQRLQSLGCTTIELRQAADLARPFDGLVLPAASPPYRRSCCMTWECSNRCANASPRASPPSAPAPASSFLADHFRTLPVTVRRNAYGRQLGSFHAEGRWEEGAKGTEEAAGAILRRRREGLLEQQRHTASEPVPLTFIRAPRIEATGPASSPSSP